MSDFIDKLKDKLKNKAGDYLDEEGVKVFVKTDLWSAFKVYDSDSPSGEPDGGGFKFPIKYSVKITNRKGDVLKQINVDPPTNKVKVAVIIGLIGVTSFVFLKGIISITNKG